MDASSPADGHKSDETIPDTLVFDGGCPVCARFAQGAARRRGGDLALVDARAGGALVDRLWQDGRDLDQGIVLVEGDETHSGHDALLRAWQTTRRRTPTRLARILVRALYPALRAGRRVLLAALGRQPLRPPSKRNGNAH